MFGLLSLLKELTGFHFETNNCYGTIFDYFYDCSICLSIPYVCITGRVGSVIWWWFYCACGGLYSDYRCRIAVICRIALLCTDIFTFGYMKRGRLWNILCLWLNSGALTAKNENLSSLIYFPISFGFRPRAIIEYGLVMK